MILITGATGQLGSATIDHLLRQGVPAGDIAALARSEEKAAALRAKGVQVRIGDYDDYGSLLRAFAGVDKLLLVSGSDIVNRSKQQLDAVRAAREAGVGHILYTSFERQDETAGSPIAFVAKSHLETEQAVRDSGIPYTIFRNGLYAEVLPMFLGPNVTETGVFMPAGDGRAAYTLRDDMAEATARVLATPGHEGKEYRFSNVATASLDEVAGLISEATGRQVPYVRPDAATYLKAMADAGLPAEIAGLVAAFGKAIEQGEFASTQSDLEPLLGRKPTGMRAFVQAAYGKA